MLQEADIGVGLFGKEGSQAARSGDYALHMFKHLQRLICVHGRYNLIRSTGLVQYSFYKNMAMFIVQLWYAIFSLFSAQTLYDGIVMAVFNVIITFLPPFFYALFERDMPEEAILANPGAYRQVMRGDHSFSILNFSYWVLSAAWHSVVIFFYTYFLYGASDIIHTNGRSVGFWEVGTTTSSIGVMTVAFMMALHMKYAPPLSNNPPLLMQSPVVAIGIGLATWGCGSALWATISSSSSKATSWPSLPPCTSSLVRTTHH